MKWLVILLVLFGLAALGGYYITRRIRAFIQRMIDPRQFTQQMNQDIGKKSRTINPGDKEIYNKDGVRIMKGDAGKD